MKAIYGFSLKHCVNRHDAEDLTQEICLKLYRVFIARDDIDDVRKFVWTVAHNALANYYRGKQVSGIGICIDDLAEIILSDENILDRIIGNETESRLHSEIAYLSKLQREIVIAYYYGNRKQVEIARSLQVPLGTIKWHLFEAKKDLKKGMETMRNTSELKFNPIKFALCGTNGSIGKKGSNSNFFRSSLSQNIAYSVRNESKSVNEIADDLGVSPVYVESEADYLAEYGFLMKKNNKYLINMLIDEQSTQMNRMQSTMYQKAAKMFANELFDELNKNELLDGKHGVIYNPMTGFENRNFMLWSLIPYIAALSGEKLMNKSISFEEAMTVRPDGGQNICYASVVDPTVEVPMYFENMKNWCGPCWNANDEFTIWQIDSEWSAKRVDDNYLYTVKRDLSLFSHFFHDEILSSDEYAYMVERGYMRTSGNIEGSFRAALNIVWLQNTDAKNELIAIGDKIKEKYKAEFDKLKAPYIKAILDATPKHLLKMQSFGLQYMFYSDGWFLLHCMKELVNNGKLKLPAEDQKKSLTTIIMPNK